MKKLLRKLIGQRIVNLFKHLPSAVIANLIYGFPSGKLIVIGVTGTDGKTTTTNMIYQILKANGRKVSMISTINAIIGNKKFDTGFHVTSPDRLMVQKLISQAVKEGSQYLVLEVTSHALDQYRTWGINFDIGVITNITHEHLDYHKTWENYFIAKSKLIKKVKFAILNYDEATTFARLSKLTKGCVISFGRNKEAMINPFNTPLNLKMMGEYNILNGLSAFAVGQSLNLDQKITVQALNQMEVLEGRMEEIKNNQRKSIIVDFAHTPNALELALKTLRSKTKGKLICVFGCPAERDVLKRPIMGKISAQLADFTVITSEDPRGEFATITKQIVAGVVDGGGKMDQTFFIEPDRQKAIEFAINKLAKVGDCVGIFGKGHEKSINLDGKNELPWSDQQVVKKVLN